MMGPADGVREALRARGLDWPAPIEHHARLGSTSDLLKEKAREGAPEWAAVLARLTVWYDALRADAPSVLRAWHACAVPWWGRRVELRSRGSVVRGVAEDLDPAGALLLTLEDGSRRTVLSGEVTAVRLAAEGTDWVGGR